MRQKGFLCSVTARWQGKMETVRATKLSFQFGFALRKGLETAGARKENLCRCTHAAEQKNWKYSLIWLLGPFWWLLAPLCFKFQQDWKVSLCLLVNYINQCRRIGTKCLFTLQAALAWTGLLHNGFPPMGKEWTSTWDSQRFICICMPEWWLLRALVCGAFQTILCGDTRQFEHHTLFETQTQTQRDLIVAANPECKICHIPITHWPRNLGYVQFELTLQLWGSNCLLCVCPREAR